MRIPELYLIICIAWLVHPLLGSDSYPPFVKSQIFKFNAPFDEAAESVNRILTVKMGKQTDEPIESGVELQQWMHDNSQWVTDQVSVLRNGFNDSTWPVANIPGRMQLPTVMANRLLPGVDTAWNIYNLADSEGSAYQMIRYAMFFGIVVENAPSLAFSLMATNANKTEVTTSDILNVQSVLGYTPGTKLRSAPSKQDWRLLHASVNPCYRLIALEKFDSVPQSPAELLALYRECLFGACSYLEVRALEAITRNQDYREEVAKLLEEYIASNPPADDGTFPHLRNNFPNLIEGAQKIIAIIRGAYKLEPPLMPPSDSFAQQALTPKPIPTTGRSNTPESPYKDAISSTLWLILAVIVIAVTRLLWPFGKERK